jgi:hypothetical protein
VVRGLLFGGGAGQRPQLLSGAENAYGFGLSAALVVPMGSAGEAGW